MEQILDERLNDKGFLLSGFGGLSVRQRVVLSLRCCEEMSFEEIGRVMNCGRLGAKSVFGLGRSLIAAFLAQNGIDRKLIVQFMVNFGIMTGEENEMDMYRMKELIGTGTISSMFDRLFLFFRYVGFVVVLMCCGQVNAEGGSAENIAVDEISSVRFVTQGVYKDGDDYKTKGAYERWCYFPEGPEGPLYYRMRRWNSNMTGKLCTWLGNGDGFYYYHSGKKVLYRKSDPIRMYMLPTDGREIFDKLYKKPAGVASLEYSWNSDNTLITSISDERVKSLGCFSRPVEYNVCEANFFELENWVKPEKVVDNRDEMHKRGWAYVKLSGSYDNQRISGAARIAFTYNEYKKMRPWLELRIGDVHIKDTAAGAVMISAGGEAKYYYQPGSFFKGIDMPWMGYHVLELIMKNAIRSKPGASYAWRGCMEITYPVGEGSFTMRYWHDEKANIVRTIGLNGKGTLELDYIKDVESVADSFSVPEVNVPENAQLLKTDFAWLADMLWDDGEVVDKKDEKQDEDLEALREKARSCRPPIY